MINQLVITNQETNTKDVEIKNLKLQNEQLKSELRHETELMERMNKQNESIKHFEDMMKSPREKDTFGLGYNKKFSSTVEGKSSKSGEQRNAKSKDKPKCHYYGKIGHRTNIYRSRNGKKIPKPKPSGNCFNCKKVGLQAHKCSVGILLEA
jgi:hypothetical protein